MKLRLVAVAAAMGVMCGVMQGQKGLAKTDVGIYVTPIFSRISNSTKDTGTFAFFGQGNTSGFFRGAAFGVYADLPHESKLGYGIDIRGAFQGKDTARLNSLLAGLRLTYQPEKSVFKPYAEMLGGLGVSSAPHNPVRRTHGQYEVVAGVDYPLSRVVDFRVIEVGYGGVGTINTAEVSDGPSSGSTSQKFSFNTGISFHF